MSFLSKLFGTRAERIIQEGNTPASSAAFRCVQVNPHGPDSCGAVRAIVGQRFLPDEIPQLPLAGCDSARCSCSYELFSDRRSVPRQEPEAASDAGAGAG